MDSSLDVEQKSSNIEKGSKHFYRKSQKWLFNSLDKIESRGMPQNMLNFNQIFSDMPKDNSSCPMTFAMSHWS